MKDTYEVYRWLVTSFKLLAKKPCLNVLFTFTNQLLTNRIIYLIGDGILLRAYIFLLDMHLKDR